jgi:hypothetical protein
MENRIIEYALEQRTDPVGYVERALINDGDAVPASTRARLEHRIREHRSRQQNTQTLHPQNGACFNITSEQARVKALMAAL